MSILLSAFPTTEPAIIVRLGVTTVSPIGAIHTGSKLFHFETPTGNIETVPGFEPAFKANVGFGADWLSFDPDGKFARIDLKAMAKTDEGHSISFGYVGVIAIDEGVAKLFDGSADAKTVPFGNCMGSYSFVVADPKLKVLENSMWASSGRIAVTETGLVVENLISKIVGKKVVTDTTL